MLISLGSNIEPEVNLTAAVERVADVLQVVAASRVFVSAAVAEGPISRSMPEFLNAAVEIMTDLSAADLKYGVLRDVEAHLGRRRGSDRNAPRPIDLDIALYGDEVIESEPLGLQVPDPEILTRAHVAGPLADLAPERVHPVTGDSLSVIATRLGAVAEKGGIRPAARSGLIRGFLDRDRRSSDPHR